MNKYQYKVQGVDYDVEIVEVEGNIAKVKVNGIEFEVELKEPIHASTMPKHPIAVKKPLLRLRHLLQPSRRQEPERRSEHHCQELSRK